MNSAQRTAYLLQIHKNPNQVNQFIQQLIVDDQADVYVHIDQRNYNQLADKIISSPNVKILPNSIVCEWGDISQVTATLLMLREAIASGNHYDFICLRSGQDLLVKEGFKEFLCENKDKIFMSFKNIHKVNLCVMKVNWPKATRRRFTTAHPLRIVRRIIQDLYRLGINIRPNTNYWPEHYQFYSGSQWFTIPHEAAAFIVEFLDQNQWFYQYFENTYTPDEWFFHTLIMNSRYKSMVVDNNLFFIKKGETFSDRNSPQNLTCGNIEEIEHSGAFFARKFDDKIDQEVIDYFSKKTGIQQKGMTAS